MTKASLEVKLQTLWTDEKQRWEETEKRTEKERRSEKRKSQKKEDAGARQGRKSRSIVFPMFCGSGGSKSRLAKAAGAEISGQLGDQKLHAVEARSTFQSQNGKNIAASEHFWKLSARKSARCCGAKQMSKPKR